MPQKKSQGFGDDFEKLAKALRLDKLAQEAASALGKEDCGCSGRKDKLNNPDLLINKVFYKNKEQDGPE